MKVPEKAGEKKILSIELHKTVFCTLGHVATMGLAIRGDNPLILRYEHVILRVSADIGATAFVGETTNKIKLSS